MKPLGKTYLLNLRTREVHDLGNRQPNCLLPMIAKENKMYLTRRQALRLLAAGIVDGCRYCMPQFDTDKKR